MRLKNITHRNPGSAFLKAKENSRQAGMTDNKRCRK